MGAVRRKLLCCYGFYFNELRCLNTPYTYLLLRRVVDMHMPLEQPHRVVFEGINSIGILF